jgi:nucleoside-diphosphate-sugar epimerase
VSEASDPLVVVTGATGFVGSHLVERLVASGARVRCLVRRTSSLGYLPRAGIELAYGDLAAGEGIDKAVEGASVVFHVAGVTKAFTESAYWVGNLDATANLLRACERQGAPSHRFIHVSSLAAVGPSPDGTPLSEDAAPRPLTWYGHSKLAAEEAVRASGLGRRAVILRPPVVYGPRDTDVLEVFRTAARGLLLRIGRGESYFNYIYVKDLAEALMLAACRDAAASRTYFVANPEPVSWTEFAATAAAVMGRKLKPVSVPRGIAYFSAWCSEKASRWRGKPGIVSRQKIREAECRYWVCDSVCARGELGFKPAYSLRQGIEETLAWYKEARWLNW